MLGLVPGDIDLVVEGDAIRLATLVTHDPSIKVITHSRFGTATLKIGKERLDMATARCETYSKSGSLPKVSPSTIFDDLHRRDLTINSMALALSGPAKGNLLDPLSGQRDLERGLIRITHKDSFMNDATRIFRAIRYEQRLSFHLERTTQTALGQAINLNALDTISPDRLRRELYLMLSEEEPLKAILRAGRLGLMHSLYRPLGNISWLERLYRINGPISPLILIAGLAYKMRLQEGEAFIKRLNMSTRWANIIRDLINLKRLDLPSYATNHSSSSLYNLLEDYSSTSVKTLVYLTTNDQVRDILVRHLEQLRNIKPISKGQDIVARGIPQGPAVGKVLALLKEARLDGRVTTKADENCLILKYAKETRD